MAKRHRITEKEEVEEWERLHLKDVICKGLGA
jgi:hypothetical protein